MVHKGAQLHNLAEFGGLVLGVPPSKTPRLAAKLFSRTPSPRHAGRWRSFDPRLTCVAELLSEPVKRGSNLDFPTLVVYPMSVFCD